MIDDLPFYTDDPDDPHWKCENCGHCKEFKMYKRIIMTHPEYFHDENNIRHENRRVYVNYVTSDYVKREMESIWMCELDHREHMDDDYCEEFIEVER